MKNSEEKPFYQVTEIPLSYDPGIDKDSDILSVVSLDHSKINVPLSAVMNESEYTFIMSPRKLQHTFSFYPNFNESDAAIFYLSLVIPKNKFKDHLITMSNTLKAQVFNEIKNVMINFKVDPLKIFAKFDVPDIPSLNSDSCSLLFEAIRPLFDKKQIPPQQLTSKWENKELQLSLISYISTHEVPEFDFSKTDRKLNTNNLTSQLYVLSKCNYCWQSLEFNERALSLIENDPILLSNLLDKLMDKSAALTLAVIGQSKSRNMNIEKLAMKALQKLLMQTDSQQLFTALYESSADFITNIVIALYKDQPSLIASIEKSTQAQFNELSLSSFVPFATDLAFASASSHSLGNFIKAYTTKYTNNILPQILDIVKRRVCDHGAKNDIYSNIALDDLFDFLNHSFDSYPIEICAIIRNVYLSCTSARTGIKNIVFKLKIPQSKLHEIKQRASMRFTKLIDQEISPEEFAKEISIASTNDPTYFSCVTHYLLTELQYLDKHATQTVEILAHLIGGLICHNCLTSKQLTFVLAFIKAAISEPERSPKFLLSTIALTDIVPELPQHPQFVFEVVRESPLRDKHTKLYDKLLKVCQSMNEPMAINHPKSITIHQKLLQFENPLPPPSTIASRIEMIENDPDLLKVVIGEAVQYTNFLAAYVVKLVMDHSRHVNKIADIVTKNSEFSKVAVMAASYFAITMVMDPLFDSPKGGLLRRRFVILGRFIGLLTLAEKKPLLSRFLDLKRLLLYSFSQGKLYGVVPFVVAIFMVASEFFNPPNPYTSSILHVLAAIYLTDCIKSSIKQQISGLFTKFNINISMFTATPHIFPEKTKDNFDFLMAPFSLLHFVAGSAADRLTQFEEATFNSFIQPYIFIPDSPTFSKHPERREFMKKKISEFALKSISSEGKKLASMAASMAIELITKDLNGCEYQRDIAKSLTRQLSAGLTLFVAPMRISRQFMNELKIPDIEHYGDWLEDITSKNYEWITQLFRDVVRARAWNEVQNYINAQEEKHAKSGKPPIKTPINPNVLQTYSDINDLSLSQQGFPLFEIQQNKEKSIKTAPAMDEFIMSFEKIIPFSSPPSEATIEDQTVQARIRECPDFTTESPSIEGLRSYVKSMLAYVAKNPRRDVEMIICQCFERVLASVPHTFVVNIRPYILSWMRISIRSSYVIGELIKMGAIDPKDLDILYTETLNAEPFNPKYAMFIAQFLHYAICETKIVEPKSMVSSLSIISALPMSSIEINQQNAEIIEKPSKALEDMDTIDHPLEKNSKLKRIMAFDEPPSSSQLDSFISELYIPGQDEQTILNASKLCTACGRPFFDALFASESSVTIRQYLRCAQEAKELTTSLQVILDSLSEIITKRGCVIGSDLRAQSSAAATTIALGCDSLENAIKIGNFLHGVRPLMCPSFTFSWVTLMSDRKLINTLLSTNEGWPLYCTLLADFVCTVGSLSTHCDSFVKIYTSILRLVLVLVHDFPNFCSAAINVIVDVAPTHLIQLRNIFLSLANPPDNQRILVPEQKFSFMDNLPTLLSGSNVDENAIRTIVSSFKSHCESDAFISCIINSLLSSTAQIEETAAYRALVHALNASSVEQCDLLCNSLFDQIRTETRESVIASKLVCSLLLDNDNDHNIFSIKDVVFKVFSQRISTPAPQPQQLINMTRDLLSQYNLWALNCVKLKPSVVNFLMAAKQAFAKK